MVKNEEMDSKFFLVKDVEKRFGQGSAKVKVLNGITTELEEGKICVILGPSGSGKSTLLNAIAGLEQIDSGTICVDREEISTHSLSIMWIPFEVRPYLNISIF